jgi:methylenetetrahydrofolate reductase (NADPH)
MTLKEKIKSGKFIVCGELSPPQSCNIETVRKKAKYFKGVVDAVNVTDNQSAVVRMSSIASAKILLDEGVEPIMQITCRDRNRLAIQSDLLGAAALGIENVLCLTGDHQKFGDHPEAKGVFDLDSTQLIATAAQLNAGSLLSGAEMKMAPNFLIGGAANPFAEPFEMRIIRLQKKIEAGAYFIQTQPVFDLELFSRWMEKIVSLGLHAKATILPGVLPVKSVKALLYMKKNVPGMKVDNSYVERMKNASDPKEEGVKIAVETINVLRKINGVRGVHLMPVMWESITPTIVKKAELD